MPESGSKITFCDPYEGNDLSVFTARPVATGKEVPTYKKKTLTVVLRKDPVVLSTQNNGNDPQKFV